MREESPLRGLRWIALGPKKQGGLVETIDAVLGTNTIYVGFGAGNIWKTVNNGLTWHPNFEHEPTFTIGDLAVSKSDPDTIWVGTGENLMARSSFAGLGVSKSTDAGKSWSSRECTKSKSEQEAQSFLVRFWSRLRLNPWSEIP